MGSGPHSYADLDPLEPIRRLHLRDLQWRDLRRAGLNIDPYNGRFLGPRFMLSAEEMVHDTEWM
jgi:hypothetical protein